ncbi:OB-fold domain-containing protein [Gordonia sp. i37]|uniref:Zn-ribbon domain-containing OB-fold protein n=1 Tax=Gordonia sp. i37 TaxID=1961707 RepID=UPI0009AC8774|nr:OB-fold domain-containing protein [Gordonia sp. i37]OPX05627.1 hypothetical protein B1964_29325 [Gordonia sp. i37]
MTDKSPIEDVRAVFWRSCSDGELRLQQCESCAKWQFYPRYLCRHCGSLDIVWQQASGDATIESFSVVNRGAGEFAALAPYVVAIVRLDEGPTLMTNIISGGPDPLDHSLLGIGMKVRVVFERRGDAVLPLFTPAGMG